jgi:heme-degrading monooxygenase HmoA
MVLIISKFKVANGMANEVEHAFLNRPHEVERAAGFVRMEVVRPCDEPNEFWLLTHWSDLASYEEWHKSPAHHQSHKSIPKGLKLDPTATQVRVFDHICL